MVRRTRAQGITNDIAFPVRVKIVVPPLGLGRLHARMHDWLRIEMASSDYAAHSQPGLGNSTAAFYFRTTEAAQRFVAAFPDADLADDTRAPGYYSPNRAPA